MLLNLHMLANPAKKMRHFKNWIRAGFCLPTDFKATMRCFKYENNNENSLREKKKTPHGLVVIALIFGSLYNGVLFKELIKCSTVRLWYEEGFFSVFHTLNEYFWVCFNASWNQPGQKKKSANYIECAVNVSFDLFVQRKVINNRSLS